MNYEDEELDDEFEDGEFDDEEEFDDKDELLESLMKLGDSQEEIDEQIKKFHLAVRNKEEDQSELPTVDIIEDIIKYCIIVENNEAALDFCLQWIEYCPTSLEPRNILCIIYTNLSRYRDAIDAADEALKIMPNDTDALRFKAFALERLGEPETALEVLLLSLEIEPDNFFGLAYTANAYREIGNYSEAIKYFEKVIAIEEDAETYANMAICYFSLKDFVNAIKYYKLAIDISPYEENYWANLGTAYLSISSYDEAISTFKMALSIDEKSFFSLTGVANAYAEMHDCINAIEYFRQALIIRPNDIDTINCYARTLAQSGDYVQAMKYFNIVLEHLPRNTKALHELAKCYLEIKDYDKFFEYINKAFDTMPFAENTHILKEEILGNFAYLQKHGNDPKFTKPKKNKIKEKENFLHYYNLAKNYFHQKEYDPALEAFEKTLSLAFAFMPGTQPLRLIADVFFWQSKIYAIQENFKESIDWLIQSFKANWNLEQRYLIEFPALLAENYSEYDKLLKKKENDEDDDN